MSNRNGISFASEGEMMLWLEKGPVYQDVLRVDRRITRVRSSGKFLQYFE